MYSLGTIVRRRILHWPTVWMTVAACLVLASLVGFAVWRAGQRAPLPASVQREVQFPLFMPAKAVIVDTASYKYDSASSVLSFTGRLRNGQLVTFTEQAAPSSFTDIPNFYQQFLQKLFEYHSFDCLNGTMYLTHPKGAGQAAVMSAKGTLLFARVASDESPSAWRTVCNDLQVYAP